MTERVDFYVLATSVVRQRWLLACRLTEQAYRNHFNVVILNDDEAAAEALDELLWTFHDGAFVPHEVSRTKASTDRSVPVWLTTDLSRIESADLLVNVSSRLPVDFARFSRIAEVIDADDQCRRLGRERYKAYRDQKLPLDTHSLDDAAALGRTA